MTGNQQADAEAVEPHDWLARAEREGTDAADALAQFDTLPAVSLAEMRGQWRGTGLPTGHALDGLLEAYGWAGKAFSDVETAHPLLFGQAGALVAIDPRWLPVARLGGTRLARSRLAILAFRLARPLLRTRRPQARLRFVTHRGVTTAAMIYDRQPIIDLFRRIAPGILLGWMDMRGQPPFFFVLRAVDGTAGGWPT